jgi:hypothetical protein
VQPVHVKSDGKTPDEALCRALCITRFASVTASSRTKRIARQRTMSNCSLKDRLAECEALSDGLVTDALAVEQRCEVFDQLGAKVDQSDCAEARQESYREAT